MVKSFFGKGEPETVKQENISSQSTSSNSGNIADEIKKYKDLLDMGAINQEEFDKKKKELLG